VPSKAQRNTHLFLTELKRGEGRTPHHSVGHSRCLVFLTYNQISTIVLLSELQPSLRSLSTSSKMAAGLNSTSADLGNVSP
jgi:hypothetical protein